MKVATKKIASLFFILLGFTPLLLSVVFVIKQQSIRHMMKERMEEQMLHAVTLPQAEIIWMKKGKEILVAGKMFDVKSIEYKNGIAIFHGLYDDDETLLNKNFMRGWEKNQSAQNQLLAELFQCLQTVYFNPSANTPALSNKQSHTFFATTDKLLSQFKTILTPPPQI